MCHQLVHNVVVNMEGTVIMFIGDNILALYGTRKRQPDKRLQPSYIPRSTIYATK